MKRSEQSERLRIRPEMPSRHALELVARSLLLTVDKTRPGVIAGVNPDCLHDFRVAIRKLRSMIGDFKRVFRTTTRNSLASSLRDVARRTNRLRDLDVLLVKVPEIHGRMHGVDAPCIDAVLRGFRRDRDREFERIRAFLQTPGYERKRAKWEVAFDEKQCFVSERGRPCKNRAIGEMIGERIGKRFAKIRRLGSSLTEESDPELFHRLRIECKKLRYLLELFDDLFEPGLLQRVTYELKALQTALGDFNDLSVQIELIRKRAEPPIGGHGERFRKKLEAVEHLTHSLQVSRSRLKKNILHAFLEFVGPKTEASLVLLKKSARL